MSTAVSTSPLSLMSCVRESSPSHDTSSDLEVEKNVASKKKFWNPRKWFRRKNKSSDDEGHHQVLQPKETLRSRSTSELSVTDERRSSAPLHPGLSVSHDSIFHSPHSNSDLELDAGQSSSSLSIIHPVPDLRLQTELSERLRLRRGRGDTSEDDEGLPRSPCNSPTTTDGLLEKANKSIPNKSHSTCSDGSLLSMGSSDMDEDSPSHHSSKISLYDKKSSDPDSDFDVSHQSVPLNHSAAHHKNAIKPKRTHGAPRRRKVQQLSPSILPSTPEVNEDASLRSLTPDTIEKEMVVETYTSHVTQTKTHISAETQMKCSSLPLGLVGPSADLERLPRSASNAGSKSDDVEEEKSDKSFFERLFPRRSAKKKRSKHEETKVTTSSYSLHSTSDSSVARTPEKRTGAASRQRIQPMDIPISSETTEEAKSSPEKPLSASPLQMELEHHFRQRMSSNPAASPEKIPRIEPKWPKTEEPRSKVKIAGLSALQQRVLSHSDEIDDGGYKSLTDLPNHVVVKPVTKSHSFKSVKPSAEQKPFSRMTYTQNVEKEMSLEKKLEIKQSIIKAASLDSIKSFPSKQEAVEESFNLCETMETDDFVKSIKSYQEIDDKQSHEKITSKTSKQFVTTSKQSKITTELPKHSTVSIDTPKQLQTSIETHKQSQISMETSKQSNITMEMDNKQLPPSMETKQSQVIMATSKQPNVSTETANKQLQTSMETPKQSQLTMTTSKQSNVTMETAKQTLVNTGFSKYFQETSRQSLESSEVNKKESTHGEVKKDSFVPEFINKPLNKVETRHSNVIFKTNSPRIVEEQVKTKSVEIERKTFQEDAEKIKEEEKETKPRKFSKDDVEIIEKDTNEEILKTPQTSRMFKKNPENPQSRKSSLVETKEKLSLKSKKSEEFSSQDSLDKLDDDGVVLRRKSLVKRTTEDEPELMKVFARRSLKLKDSESEQISENIAKEISNSDKENFEESPREEITKEAELKSAETKFVESVQVTLRKPLGNNKFAYQRTASLTQPKANSEVIEVKKQGSFNERPKTENWFINVKKQEVEKEDERKIVSEDIISPKSDFINEEEFSAKPKNFNQRKAEWEKRAQEALKKTA